MRFISIIWNNETYQIIVQSFIFRRRLGQPVINVSVSATRLLWLLFNYIDATLVIRGSFEKILNDLEDLSSRIFLGCFLLDRVRDFECVWRDVDWAWTNIVGWSVLSLSMYYELPSGFTRQILISTLMNSFDFHRPTSISTLIALYVTPSAKFGSSYQSSFVLCTPSGSLHLRSYHNLWF